MVGVNLLPSSVVLARRRSTRIRRWVGVITIVGAIAAVPVGVSVINSARAASLRRNIEPAVQRLGAVHARLTALSEEYRVATGQMARADALRSKRDWSGLLLTIAQRMPEQVWLVTMETRSETGLADAWPNAAPRGKPASAQALPIVLEGPTGLIITGYAVDHDSILAFISALNSDGVFKRVDLKNSANEPFLEGSAVRFVLECDW